MAKTKTTAKCPDCDPVTLYYCPKHCPTCQSADRCDIHRVAHPAQVQTHSHDNMNAAVRFRCMLVDAHDRPGHQKNVIPDCPKCVWPIFRRPPMDERQILVRQIAEGFCRYPQYDYVTDDNWLLAVTTKEIRHRGAGALMVAKGQRVLVRPADSRRDVEVEGLFDCLFIYPDTTAEGYASRMTGDSGHTVVDPKSVAVSTGYNVHVGRDADARLRILRNTRFTEVKGESAVRLEADYNRFVHAYAHYGALVNTLKSIAKYDGGEHSGRSAAEAAERALRQAVEL